MPRPPVTFKTLPGSSPARSVALNTDTVPFVRTWSMGEVERGGGYSEDYYGAIAGTVGRMTKQLTLDCILDDETLRQVRSLRASAEPFAVSPPWAGSTTLCHLSLQHPVDAREGHLTETRVKAQRVAATFARYSKRFHPITGLPVPFDVPLYTAAAWDGQSINIGNVINDTHHPSFELRSYAVMNAADGTNVTYFYIDPAEAQRWYDYRVPGIVKVMVSTEGETANTFEIAEIDSVTVATGRITLSTPTGGAASGVLTGTANYTRRKRAYVSSILVSDCEMEDSGMGSWADQGTPTIAEKSETMQETGSRCLRISGDAGDEGVYQTLGYVPAGTDMVLWVRAKQVQCSGASWLKMQVYNVTDAAASLTQHAPVADTAWTWYRYCFEVARGGAGQKQLKLQLMTSIGGGDEALIDRVYVFQNSVDNGGMEGTPEAGQAQAAWLYDAEDAVTPASSAATTYTDTTVVDAAAWDLSLGAVGMIAVASGGSKGRVTIVNDGTDTVTVADWRPANPANGETCRLHFAVAPGWTQINCEAADDKLTQDLGEHGGEFAQGVNVTADGEGIRTNGLLTSGAWYLCAGYFNVTAGVAKIQVDTDAPTLAVTTTTGSYEYISGLVLTTGARMLRTVAYGAAATFLVDDVMALRLPGNPYDDAVYDLPAPLSTTAWTLGKSWVPGLASGSMPAGEQNLGYWSRRTADVNNNMRLIWNAGTMYAKLTIGGVAKQATAACTFAAGDSVFVFARYDSATQNMVLWARVNQAAITTGTVATGFAASASGITRMWLGRVGTAYGSTPLGSLSCIAIENTALTDAQVTEILGILSGSTGYEAKHALLDETYGILFKLEDNSITVMGPAAGDRHRVRIVATEVDRIGALYAGVT